MSFLFAELPPKNCFDMNYIVLQKNIKIDILVRDRFFTKRKAFPDGLVNEMCREINLMTEEQLYLWQRSAIFECECDNLINQHIEADDRQHNRLRVYRRANRRRMDAALDAAINAHGIRLNNNDAGIPNAIPQRNHRNQLGEHQNWDDRNLFAVVLDTSYTAAIRNRGLHLPRRSP